MGEMKVPKYSTKPTIGRIVVYISDSGVVVPAIVQAVHDVPGAETVRLCVFLSNGPTMVDSVSHGDAAGQWSWPKRVEAGGPIEETK